MLGILLAMIDEEWQKTMSGCEQIWLEFQD